jgi:aspartyl aminopeptidase
MNGGIVIKTNSSQRYTTDAISFAIVKKICEKAGVPCQNYANRADLAGGSTLGNIALHQLPVCCADVGLAQLAMHSSYETAGVKDALYLKNAAKVLFETKFTAESDFGYTLD